MNLQTESSTPVATSVEPSSYVKALCKGETVFCLRSQDVTAPLVVAFWVKLQQKVREYMDAGLTMTEAVRQAEIYYFLESVDAPATDAKLSQALLIAREMTGFANRRLAD